MALVEREEEEAKAEAVFVGHSMGALAASYAALERRERSRTRALILVAPALRAVSSNSNKGVAAGRRGLLARLVLLLGEKVGVLVVQPFLLLILRQLVRSKTFWQKGLAAAWHAREKVDLGVVDGYRRAKLVRGWDVGMCRFVFAALFHSESNAATMAAVAEAAAKDRIKVLIVHGAQDRIVPAANSARLAALIPNCTYHSIANCGHNPQEEAAEEFIDVVTTFLEREL